MKAFPKVNKHSVVFGAALICLMVAGSVSAFAADAGVARSLSGQTITAQCCVLTGLTAKLTEPIVIAPVTVTFNADYSITGESVFALSVNGGPCLNFGSAIAAYLQHEGGNAVYSSTYQWVVLPTDGVLVNGSNIFSLCTGGHEISQTVMLGFRTLEARIVK
jgi:hypothetical protein